MPTKYDTNPLDPDFPERIKAEAEAEVATQYLPQGAAGTQPFPAESEEQTRRFFPRDAASFVVDPYTGQNVPATYQPPNRSDVDHSSERRVAKIGLPENVLTAVPYIPWYLGMVVGIVLLLLLPKSETKVRFHAAQGVAAHIGIFAVGMALGVIGAFASIAEVGEFIFGLVTTIMLIIFALRAWKGKPVHIESVDGLTNWLEEKLGPIKGG